MFGYIGAIFCTVVLPMWTMSSAKGMQKNHMATPVKVARQQTTPKLSGTFRTLPPKPTPARTGTLHNSPKLSGTYTSTLEFSGTFRNLPPEPTARNSPEPKGMFRNCPSELSGTLGSLHQHTPELSGTFRNLPLKPTPASTHWNSPEPSGTFPCDLHRHTPELIWAEDPISLRC